MRARPQVAVAVVSYETRELLRSCLRALEADAAAGRAEVWVVDNGSRDGSPELVREEFAWARLLEPGGNVGFGRAVNLVAERTSGAWIAPANADVEPAPGALEALLAAAGRAPEAGILAPRLVLDDGSTQHSVRPFPTLAFTAAFAAGLGRLPGLGERWCLERRWDPGREREVPWAVGAFLLVRREAWDAAGGFDPQQWLFAEDLDLGWRVRRAGWTTRYVPQAVVAHHESAATAAAFGDERELRWQTATYAWMARRVGRRRTAAAAAVNLAAAAARARTFGALARLDPERWQPRADDFGAWAQLHRRAAQAAGTGRAASRRR